MSSLQSTGQVVRTLGTTPRKLDRLFERRPDLEPKLRVGGRRAFTADEVERLRAALADVGRPRAHEAVREGGA